MKKKKVKPTKGKPKTTIKEWKAMVNANKADGEFVPLAEQLTPEKIKTLKKLAKGE